ncbi:hypothetical protein CSB45_01800 [candidate division KSB3 bacterium]|uniref:Steroid 5-alpha reductase C-terminal domain-containing protein n=1 Tax=candidate division KSB3 bacterium TaxID=2044937 RepID=A0A2G6EAN4_9BACT|nr:MAG: hypothetical protein CSB45_01800 [candidate division KSB3 bacterium]
MEKYTVLDKMLLFKPLTRGAIEWICMVAVGIAGFVLSWTKIPAVPYLNVFGVVLFALGFWLHVRCEQVHKQAHVSSEQIDGIVTTGLYAWLRHPIYLSLLMMNLGMGLAFGLVITVVLALIFSGLWGLTALAEEKFLRQKFPEAYRRYMQDVKWRILPYIF